MMVMICTAHKHTKHNIMNHDAIVGKGRTPTKLFTVLIVANKLEQSKWVTKQHSTWARALSHYH